MDNEVVKNKKQMEVLISSLLRQSKIFIETMDKLRKIDLTEDQLIKIEKVLYKQMWVKLECK